MNRVVLLLQGPVGYFFDRLHKEMIEKNITSWHVIFNAGDRFFLSVTTNKLFFNGDIKEWKSWLLECIKNRNITDIILFGCRRPIHYIARNIAIQKNIKILSLEEGYLRPGFVTIEYFGNNADSLYSCQLPTQDFVNVNIKNNIKKFNNTKTLLFYSALYYSISALFSSKKQKTLQHKKVSLISESFFWLKNAYNYIRYKNINNTERYQLITKYKKKYFLVALQVNNDCQIEYFSNGWNSNKLIHSVIASFSYYADDSYCLLFKIHPLERGRSHQRKLILSIANQYNLASRIKIIETGTISALVRYSAGIITINSTVGLRAIYYGIPLLVLGKAIYSNKYLVSIGKSIADINTFWRKNFIADAFLRKKYIDWLRYSCLQQGDFYITKQINNIINNIVNRY